MLAKHLKKKTSYENRVNLFTCRGNLSKFTISDVKFTICFFCVLIVNVIGNGQKNCGKIHYICVRDRSKRTENSGFQINVCAEIPSDEMSG